MPQTQEDFESLTLLDKGEYNEGKGTSQNELLQKSNLSTALIVGLIIFFMVDTFAFFAVAKLLLDVTSSLQDADKMEFRNPYIGLDELYKFHEIKPSSYNKLINEPKLATQISSTEPNKVFPVDVHRWLSDFGVLSPPDRHLQVSKDIHTIVQYNVLDYGMEKCTIAVRLPARGEVLPHPYALPDSGSTVRLNICELDVKRPLKELTLSWSNRPPCTRQLDPIEAIIGGEVETDFFFCKSGSYLAYQVSCAGNSPGCNVDVWTNHNQTWGVFINQYQTV